MGRLTKSPDTRQSGDNTVTRFTIAVDRRFKKDGDNTADFISCVAFGKTSTFISKYFDKGNRIAVSGRIQTNSYTNKEGQKVYTTDVIVEEVDFCESKSSETKAPAEKADDGFADVSDEIDNDLPFN